jgi:hypothetical protein
MINNWRDERGECDHHKDQAYDHRIDTEIIPLGRRHTPAIIRSVRERVSRGCILFVSLGSMRIGRYLDPICAER